MYLNAFVGIFVSQFTRQLAGCVNFNYIRKLHFRVVGTLFGGVLLEGDVLVFD